MFVLTVLLIAALAEGGIVSKDKCDEPLGMENGRITNAQLSASSSYEINSVGPLQARLNNNNGGGAWCPKSFISETSGVDEFLEIDLGEEHSVTGVVTQGRFANGLGQEFAEFFLVQFWKPGMEDFSEFIYDLAYIILDSSSVFSSGSFDSIRDSRRWLIIAGQENKAFAAHYLNFLLL